MERLGHRAGRTMARHCLLRRHHRGRFRDLRFFELSSDPAIRFGRGMRHDCRYRGESISASPLGRSLVENSAPRGVESLSGSLIGDLDGKPWAKGLDSKCWSFEVLSERMVGY